ncbi:MAG: hypothetical protein KC619_18465 [Myxococcales bacterium]|nr:hypothetical protein [Myxococcales bacterium]
MRSAGLALLLLLLAAPAAAQQAVPEPAPEAETEATPDDPNVAEARALFERGLELADDSLWGQAYDAFRRSFALVERASTLLNLASALEHVSRNVEAIEGFERFLRMTDDATDAERRALAQRAIERLDGRVAIVELTLTPADAVVLVDGVVREDLGSPRYVRVDPGPRNLRVRADGYEDAALRVDAVGGDRHTHTVALELLPEPEPEIVRVVVTETRPTDPDPWIAFGGAALVGIGGAVMLILAQNDADVVQGVRDGASTWPEVQAVYERAWALRVAGGIAIGLGVAGMALGVAWHVIIDGEADEPSVEVGLVPAGLGVSGRF